MVFASEIRSMPEFARFCSVSAIILESITPKPGNVYLGNPFADMSVRDFIASAIAIGPTVTRLSRQAARIATGMLSLRNMRLGRFLCEATSAMKSATGGPNTIFGTILMHVPIIAAASYCYARYDDISLAKLRKGADLFAKATTVRDAVDFYRSVRMANVGGLNSNPVETLPDARMRGTEAVLRAKKLTLHDIMRESSGIDRIASEWNSGFTIVSRIGYPSLATALNRSGSLPKAIGHCFLTILSKYPDTLIAKRKGAAIAAQISSKASKALRAGSYFTRDGLRAVEALDRSLRDKKNRLNPGTTADLASASILVALLLGLKMKEIKHSGLGIPSIL